MVKINGVTTQYYRDKETDKGIIEVPTILADALNWEDHENITIMIKTIDFEPGLFIFKPKHVVIH